VEEVIRDARTWPDVCFARRIGIARWWLEHYGDLSAMKS